MLIICVTSNTYGQINDTVSKSPDNTLYIKKQETGDVKKVFVVGNKIDITYKQDNQTNISGIITGIGNQLIAVEDSIIPINTISEISAMSNQRLFLSSIMFVAGSGLVALGIKFLKRPSSCGSGLCLDFSDEITGGALILIGGTISTISFYKILSPKTFTSEKFSFHTYIE